MVMGSRFRLTVYTFGIAHLRNSGPSEQWTFETVDDNLVNSNHRPDNVGTAVKVVNGRQTVLAARPTLCGKQHSRLELRHIQPCINTITYLH